MLFGESNEMFQQNLEATFGTFKSKLVDVAMQSAGFMVISPDHSKCSHISSDRDMLRFKVPR